MQSSQLASCLVQGFVDQDVYSTPNGRNKSKRPLSADNSMDESTSEPKKFRYEDLSSITEDIELSQLDSLSKEAITTKLGAALDFVKLQHDRIIKLESELINAKLAFANATINQFNSKQPSLVCQAPLTQGLPLRPSYAQATRVEPAPVLVANLAKGSTPSDKISLEKMEQLLDSNTGGPVPSSVRQKDSTVFVRLNNPADFDRAKSILESRQNVDSINMFSSISRSSKLYPAVALFVDLSLLPGLKNELMLRNEAFKGKIDSVTQIYKKPGTNKGHVKIFFNCRDIRDYALMGGEVDFFNTTARLVEVLLDREVRRCFNCQGYGHSQASCRSTSPRCGKCAGSHRTRECTGTIKKCANCSGPHEAGDRFCTVQMKAVARYRIRLERN
jgi:hypothetical protein